MTDHQIIEEQIEQDVETGEPGHNPRNQAVPAQRLPAAPPDPDPPARHEQDTQPVEGEAAIHPPPGTELIQRSKVQG
jgi:hypothetical protein